RRPPSCLPRRAFASSAPAAESTRTRTVSRCWNWTCVPTIPSSAVWRKCRRGRGRIDVLINNAGVEHVGVAEETTLEDARAVFETNFFGVVRMTNAVLPDMRDRRQGRIINVGSLAAWVGEPGGAFYSASKHALAGYTEALRHEVWRFGIHVSLAEPGVFKTNIIQAASMTEGT